MIICGFCEIARRKRGGRHGARRIDLNRGPPYKLWGLERNSYVTLSLLLEAILDLNELADRIPTNDDVVQHTPSTAALAKLRRLRQAVGCMA